ncbi:type II toxin-antitoxin system RelB family antitoxin [Aquibaculum arenosum]|uniref:CopG family transcriptional regulator n=1 Tax=Aquibaculum arenosum TaxID=3032591 RepID=A0ABT5YQQ4_9PROT|nr:CopG family transcriptional regulator [Fodinicurvata sp. CAU 1616]MDF2097306.1 CopG family transcriptional regulator [Fodinicurvata sp. CAU 1616]
MLAIKLPKDIEDRLEALAAETGRPKDEHALEAILDYLDDIEDRVLAQQRSARLKSGKDTAVSISALKKEHGLAD